MLDNNIPLSLHEALSGVLGSISLASWIFLLIPQLVENYRCKSAEGVSLLFLSVWFVGDLANFFGAIWAGLVPTVIAIAIYFCFADSVLITQCLYYNLINARKVVRKQSQETSDADDPQQPLLRRHSSSNIGLPGSRRRPSLSQRRRDSSLPSPLPTIPEGNSVRKPWLMNTLSILLVFIVGAAGWAIAWRIGVWIPTSDEVNDGTSSQVLGASILGYLSATCYLGARIPQIVKNYREQSCEGLSLLFFMLSLLGNTTYGGGILFHSTAKGYLLRNLPWLIGSLGTMGEDILIFIQFHLYPKKAIGEVSSAIE